MEPLKKLDKLYKDSKPGIHHNGKRRKMSMLWLISPNDTWADEAHQVLSGIVATRRVASLQNFSRLVALASVSEMTGVFAVMRLSGSEEEMALHGAISRFMDASRGAQMVCLGFATDSQKRLLEAMNVAFLGNIDDHLYLATLIQNIRRQDPPSRSGARSTSAKIQFGDIEVDLTSGLFRILATDIREQLTPKEVRIMQVLTERGNQPVTRDDLVGRVWSGLKVSSSTVDSHMSRLRKKVERSFECNLETEYGSGWKLSVKI
jgi:hypothetical protein